MDQEKSFWEILAFSPEEANNDTQIFSLLRQILHNISNQFYSYNNFDYRLSPSSNLTMNIFADTFNFKLDTDNPSVENTINNLLYLGVYFQYFITFGMTLISGWIMNKATWKSEILKDILETFISFLLIVPVLPAILAFFGVILIARGFVYAYIKLSHPDGKVQLVTPEDAFWSYEVYASCSSCIGLYIVEGKCDPEVISKRMKKTIESDLVGGKMSRKLISVFGFSCWETLDEKEMDMKNYVKIILDEGGRAVGKQEVFEFMQTIQDKPSVNKAPWDICVIPKFTYESQPQNGNEANTVTKHYAVLFRMHHSIMDGISTGNILHSVMADKPFKFSLDPVAPGSKKPSRLQTIVLAILGIISVPRVGLRNLLHSDIYQNKYYIPGPQLTGPKTFTWSRPIKMEALKQIKNGTKTSVYAVLISCLGGAMRQLHLKNGKEIDYENFHVISPVALLPYPDRKPGNRFTGIIVPTSAGGESSVERLNKNYDTLKQLGSASATFLAMANWYFPAMLGLMPLFLHKPFSMMMQINMSLSNVPGPAEDVLIYDGGKIVDIGAWLPIKFSLGLGMGLFSYKDRVRATIIADKAYYEKESDVEFLSNRFEQELSLLGKSVGIDEVFMTDCDS